MRFETEYIERLAQVLSETGLTEISLEDGEQAITLRKEVIVSSSVGAVSVPSVQTTVAPEQTSAAENTSSEFKKGTPITSPMVGTFYKAPSPDSEPFVYEGSKVKAGDVVCIVEAMKMMNEIKTEVSGKVVEICIEDGQPVEFGQVLMYVE